MSITEAAGGRRTAKADAMEVLQGVLTGDPVPATEVSRMAHAHSLTPKAIRLAREALGVEIERHGFGVGSKSIWSLPGGAHRSPSFRRESWREPGGAKHERDPPTENHRWL